MAKKNYTKTDSRAYLISLKASIFTVIIITIIDIIVDFFNAYDCNITPFLAKITIIGVLALVVFIINGQYNEDHRKR